MAPSIDSAAAGTSAVSHQRSTHDNALDSSHLLSTEHEHEEHDGATTTVIVSAGGSSLMAAAEAAEGGFDNLLDDNCSLVTDVMGSTTLHRRSNHNDHYNNHNDENHSDSNSENSSLTENSETDNHDHFSSMDIVEVRSSPDNIVTSFIAPTFVPATSTTATIDGVVASEKFWTRRLAGRASTIMSIAGMSLNTKNKLRVHVGSDTVPDNGTLYSLMMLL